MVDKPVGVFGGTIILRIPGCIRSRTRADDLESGLVGLLLQPMGIPIHSLVDNKSAHSYESDSSDDGRIEQLERLSLGQSPDK